jgi:hypothetical protein
MASRECVVAFVVARIEHSEIRGWAIIKIVPDFAALNPGYKSVTCAIQLTHPFPEGILTA